jgi:hypothetical protein
MWQQSEGFISKFIFESCYDGEAVNFIFSLKISRSTFLKAWKDEWYLCFE